MNGSWKAVDKFVHWCFASEEEIIGFYNEFFRSKKFAELFDHGHKPSFEAGSLSVDVSKSVKAVVFLVKMTNLSSRLDTNELLVDVCSNILSHPFHFYYDCKSRENSKIVFEALDAFMLAFLNNDEKMLTDMKREWFTNKSRKLYISLPLDFLRKQLR